MERDGGILVFEALGSKDCFDGGDVFGLKRVCGLNDLRGRLATGVNMVLVIGHGSTRVVIRNVKPAFCFDDWVQSVEGLE